MSNHTAAGRLSEVAASSNGRRTHQKTHCKRSGSRRKFHLDAGDPLQAAMYYSGLDWIVLPLHSPTGDGGCSCGKPTCGRQGKHPRIRWSAASRDTETIRRWFVDDYPQANIGIVTGADSGIFVLDMDSNGGGSESLIALERQYGGIPLTATVHSGGGGLHFYFRHPGRKVTTSSGRLGPGVDVRGDGGIIVAPPSVHHGGGLYHWIDGLSPAEMPIADAPEWLLKLVTKSCEAAPIASVFSVVSVLSVNSVLLCPSPSLSVTEAINRTLPTDEGQRHRCIFELARALKSIPEFKKAPAAQLRTHVQEWHRKALPVIRTKAFDETWLDFHHAWERVKFPLGEGPIADVVAAAKAAADPDVARNYDTDETRLLIKVCRELQRAAGDKPFFISCRTAADIMEIDRNTSARRLKMLVADGVLAIAEQHTNRRAARYRYLGDSNHGHTEAGALPHSGTAEEQ